MSNRAEWNTTCDVWSGPPTNPAPTLLAEDVPCRFVPATQILGPAYPWNQCLGYVTLPYPVVGAIGVTASGNTLTLNFSSANTLSLPAGGMRNLWVFYVERVEPFLGVGYWRCYVTATPLTPGV